MLDQIKAKLDTLKREGIVTSLTMRQANALYVNGQCQILTCTRDSFHLSIDDEFKDFDLYLVFNDERIETRCSCKSSRAECHHAIAGLLELSDYLQRDEPPDSDAGKTYTRKGMIKRVLDERCERADKAEYDIEFADNVFGEHELVNERGLRYRLTFRNLGKQQGYCSCPDYRTNKLGTCKHLLYAFTLFREKHGSEATPHQEYPFIEVFQDPLSDYEISWFYPGQLPKGFDLLIEEYFTPEQKLRPEKKGDFLSFIEKTREMKEILIRPEVLEAIGEFFEQQLLAEIQADSSPDFSGITAELFPYQKEGIEFATFRKGSIIDDEMGIVKTVKAIGAAIRLT